MTRCHVRLRRECVDGDQTSSALDLIDRNSHLSIDSADDHMTGERFLDDHRGICNVLHTIERFIECACQRT